LRRVDGLDTNLTALPGLSESAVFTLAAIPGACAGAGRLICLVQIHANQARTIQVPLIGPENAPQFGSKFLQPGNHVLQIKLQFERERKPKQCG
jgi:hypothetical protein